MVPLLTTRGGPLRHNELGAMATGIVAALFLAVPLAVVWDGVTRFLGGWPHLPLWLLLVRLRGGSFALLRETVLPPCQRP